VVSVMQMSFALAWRFGLGLLICFALAWLVINFGGRS
jgi:hypothetical protein